MSSFVLVGLRCLRGALLAAAAALLPAAAAVQTQCTAAPDPGASLAQQGAALLQTRGEVRSAPGGSVAEQQPGPPEHQETPAVADLALLEGRGALGGSAALPVPPQGPAPLQEHREVGRDLQQQPPQQPPQQQPQQQQQAVPLVAAPLAAVAQDPQAPPQQLQAPMAMAAEVGGAQDGGGAEEATTPVLGAKIAPFGKEDTAQELQKHAAHTQDTLVDAVENAEVAEIKRAVFRALTRLRAAEIKEFDTIARLETQAVDEYNDNHHYRSENPLHYLHNGEVKVSEDKYTSFHNE